MSLILQATCNPQKERTRGKNTTIYNRKEEDSKLANIIVVNVAKKTVPKRTVVKEITMKKIQEKNSCGAQRIGFWCNHLYRVL